MNVLAPIFRSWFLVNFGDEVTKIWKYYVIFVYILQGKMGKMEKNGKKIMQLKWPKYQKPKDENMGWAKQCRKKKTQKKIFTITSRGFVSGLTFFRAYLVNSLKALNRVVVCTERRKKPRRSLQTGAFENNPSVRQDVNKTKTSQCCNVMCNISSDIVRRPHNF